MQLRWLYQLHDMCTALINECTSSCSCAGVYLHAIYYVCSWTWATLAGALCVLH